MDKYDTVIISGGGAKGIAALGILQSAIDNNKLTKVKKYIGTSIGSIIAYLLCIGYTPIELIICLHQSAILDELRIFNIGNIITGNGVTKWSIINNFLEKITINKVGFLLTLEDIYNKYSLELVLCTYNYSLRKKEYISYKNYPKIPSLIAIRMSCNLPLIFDRFKYMGCYFIDGGIVDNFPLCLAKDNEKTLAIKLADSRDNYDDKKFDILEYIFDIICIHVEEYNKDEILKVKSNCDIINIEIKDMNIYKFHISLKQIFDLFSLGYKKYAKYNLK